jgi:hypothetical protein
MTTLGALSVGLLVLVLIVAAGIALLARSQRRSPRGPEQPRTVADLVRMREAAAEAGTVAGPDASPAEPPAPTEVATPEAVATPEGEPGSAVAESPQPVESPEPVKSGEPFDAEAEVPQAPAAEAPQSAAGHESADAGAPASLQDTPWARAARMADPLGEWTASARAAREREGTSGPRQAPREVPKSATREKDPHDTTTVTHLPQGFGQVPPEELDDDETVQIGRPAGAEVGAQAPSDTDDSVTVKFTGPLAARLAAEPVSRPPTAEPSPDEPTAPVDPTASAVCGTAIARSTVAVAPVPTPGRIAGRVRRSPADTAAEQAAADLALLRTFGVAGPGRTAAADDTEVELEGCSPDDAEPCGGTAQPVAFRVVDRDGRGLAGASVTLLDDHGREISGTAADENGAGRLTARRPGGYMLVTAADGYQPGAATIAVADAPVDTEIPLTRSASIAGSVCGEDGPIVGARLVLVQDGEIVDTADSGVDGAYMFADLAAGEYGLSVTASECEPAALVLRLADETDLRHDVDLDPVGLPAGDATGDVMIGHL